MFKPEDIRHDFPVLAANPELAYLDTAATAQTPRVVIEAMADYYTAARANVHRGLYPLSEEATRRYEAARQTVANFVGVTAGQVVFTGGATAALNMLANSLTSGLGQGDNVVISRAEHHANLIPWQQAAQQRGFELRFIEMNEGRFDMASAAAVINGQTKVVSVAHVSNVFGVANPINEIVQLAHRVGATVVVDGCQAIVHQTVNAAALGCDYYVFAGHKLYGPTGIGVIVGRAEALATLSPSIFGGEMVKEVRYDGASWDDVPHRFEAGTPPIAEAIGLAAAIDYITGHDRVAIAAHESAVTDYLFSQLLKIKGLTIISPRKGNCGVVTFTMKSLHPHDVASIAGQAGVALRAGHHCAMPLHTLLGIPASLRVSVGMYTTTKDVDRLIAALEHAKTVFHL